jgi:peroxiredoxin
MTNAAAPAKDAPEFALPDLEGHTVRLEDLRGKPVLIDFWATWCDPCKDSIPAYQKLYEKQRSRGLTVVGIDEDTNVEDARTFVKKNAMAYPVLLDPQRRTFDSFDVSGLPTTFLIDDEGRIRGRWVSFDSTIASEIEKEVEALLKKN